MIETFPISRRIFVDAARISSGFLMLATNFNKFLQEHREEQT